MNRSQTTRISPALESRIARLDGCAGRWIVDISECPRGAYSGDEETINGNLPVPADNEQGWQWFDSAEAAEATGYPAGSPELAAFYCAQTGWRARLVFTANKLNADCSWPGGYDAPSIYRSNNRVFREDFSEALESAETSHDGLALDVRFCTDEMVDVIVGLEDYPIVSEDDHGMLEIELQDEAWQGWAAAEWRGAVERALSQYAPEGASLYWADERLESVELAKGAEVFAAELRTLFEACADQRGAYWHEESGSQSVDIDRAATGIDRADLIDLTGLALLSPEQEWRREPYPWPHAEPSPLEPALPV